MSHALEFKPKLKEMMLGGRQGMLTIFNEKNKNNDKFEKSCNVL